MHTKDAVKFCRIAKDTDGEILIIDITGEENADVVAFVGMEIDDPMANAKLLVKLRQCVRLCLWRYPIFAQSKGISAHTTASVILSLFLTLTML